MHVAKTPSTALSGVCGGGGGHTSAPHWIRSWASPNKCVSIEKQAHAMGKTKDLYLAFCPTGGCTHHLPFCLSEVPAFLCMPQYISTIHNLLVLAYTKHTCTYKQLATKQSV